MKALVTGGAGFIGSHLVDRLLSDGADVCVIDNLSTGQKENLSEALKNKDRFRLCELDVVSKEAGKVLRDFSPEVVFHLAAQMNVRKSVEDPVFDAQQNVLGIVNVLENAVTVGAKRFIFSSTGGAIYGEQNQFPAPESHEINPKSPYGVSKRAGELYLQYYAENSPLQIVALRYANVYGPRQNAKGEAGVVAIFCGKAIKGEPLVVNGTGEQTRDYVYVEDVTRANVAAATCSLDEQFSIYNIGTGKESSVIDIVNGVKSSWAQWSCQDKPSDFEIKHGPAMPGEQMRSVVDASSFAKDAKWQPVTDFSAGINTTFRSFIV